MNETLRYQMIVNQKVVASESNLSLLLLIAKKRWEYSLAHVENAEHIQVIDTALSFDGQTQEKHTIWDSNLIITEVKNEKL